MMMSNQQQWRGFTVVTAVTMIMMGSAWRAIAANLIVDPSFEATDLSAYSRAVWTGTAQIGLSNNEAHTGSQSVHISGTNASATVWQTVVVLPQTDCSASMWLKSSGLSGAGKTGMEIKTNGSYYYLSPDNQPNDGQWHKLQAQFNTGTATEITFICAFEMYGNGSGEVWFDDLELAVPNTPSPPVITPPYTLTFGPGPGGKTGFFLNGQRFNPVVFTKSLPAPTANEITRYRNDGFNMLYLPINPTDAASANIRNYLTVCRDQSMPVIVEYNTAMWNGWLQGDAARNMGLSPKYPVARKTRVDYFPDFLKQEVRDYVANEVSSIIGALSGFHHSPVAAYSIGAYDYYHLPDGEIHAQFSTIYPHPLGEGKQTWLPYGINVTADFQRFLTENSVPPSSLGFSTINDVPTPTDRASAGNSEHWRWWALYRRDYVRAYTSIVTERFKTLSGLPVTGSYDLNFSSDENFATPITSWSALFDFFILYHYSFGQYTPSQSVDGMHRTVHNELHRAGHPSLSMFEFSSQIGNNPIPIYDYMNGAIPFVSGYHYQYNSTLYNEFKTIIGNINAGSLWETQPETATLALFLSPLDIWNWQRGFASSVFTNDLPRSFDLLYHIEDFPQYKSLYVMPAQPAFQADAAGQAAVNSFRAGGGTVIDSLYQLASNPFLLTGFETGSPGFTAWLGSAGQGATSATRVAGNAHTGVYCLRWAYAYPGNSTVAILDLPITERNLKGLQKAGLWCRINGTGFKLGNIMYMELLRNGQGSLIPGWWTAVSPGVPCNTWTMREWSITGQPDMSEVTALRLWIVSDTNWTAVSGGNQISLDLDDVTFTFKPWDPSGIGEWSLY
ncbi:MAG: hypothetical protein WCK47_04680 [bacterium]